MLPGPGDRSFRQASEVWERFGPGLSVGGSAACDIPGLSFEGWAPLGETCDIPGLSCEGWAPLWDAYDIPGLSFGAWIPVRENSRRFIGAAFLKCRRPSLRPFLVACICSEEVLSGGHDRAWSRTPAGLKSLSRDGVTVISLGVLFYFYYNITIRNQ